MAIERIVEARNVETVADELRIPMQQYVQFCLVALVEDLFCTFTVLEGI